MIIQLILMVTASSILGAFGQTAPAEWTWMTNYYGDNYCDCVNTPDGTGVIDIDCLNPEDGSIRDDISEAEWCDECAFDAAPPGVLHENGYCGCPHPMYEDARSGDNCVVGTSMCRQQFHTPAGTDLCNDWGAKYFQGVWGYAGPFNREQCISGCADSSNCRKVQYLDGPQRCFFQNAHVHNTYPDLSDGTLTPYSDALTYNPSWVNFTDWESHENWPTAEIYTRCVSDRDPTDPCASAGGDPCLVAKEAMSGCQRNVNTGLWEPADCTAKFTTVIDACGSTCLQI